MTARKHLSYLCSLKKTKRANKSNMNALQITSGAVQYATRLCANESWVGTCRTCCNELCVVFYILEITIIL